MKQKGNRLLLHCLACYLALVMQSCEAPEAETGRHVEQLLEEAAARALPGNDSAALKFLDSSVKIDELNISEKMSILIFKADVYNNTLHDYETARFLADSIYTILNTQKPGSYQTQLTLVNYLLGDIYFHKQDYNNAYLHYYRARAIGKSNFDSCTLREYSFRLAVVLYRQSRFREAAEKFKESFRRSSGCIFNFDSYFRLQQVLNNIGLSYYKSGEYDSAMLYYQKGLSYIAEHRGKFPDRPYLNDVANAVIYGNMADLFRISGDTGQAKYFLEQSIQINNRIGHDINDAQYSMVKLADILVAEGAIDSALLVLQQLEKSLQQTPNPRASMDWNRLMWKYHTTGRNTEKAYRHLLQFTNLRDSLEQEANKLKAADMSQQIRMMESEYEIKALQADNRLKNVYLVLAGLIAIIGFLLVYFILRNLKNSRQNIALLQQLNSQIRDQKTQLENTLKELEEKNQQQQRILRAVAHDLRSPIATISMLCELVQAEDDKASRTEMVSFIQKSCSNSLDLIAEILEAADTSQRREEEKEPVNIGQLINSTVDLLQIKASEKQQQINVHIPAEPVFLMVNPEKFKRVLNNLINNAIKFSPRGEIIDVRFAHEYTTNTISVEDRGVGIPPELQPKVFDMFTDAKRKGTAGELAYGLGLSICKQIVEAHNGKIWFTSAPGKGTTFFVNLP